MYAGDNAQNLNIYTCMNPHHDCSHREGNPSQSVYLEQSLMVGLQRRADPNITGNVLILNFSERFFFAWMRI